MTALRAALAILALALALTAPVAFAHASLVRSVPADGTVVDAAPDELVLQFDEPVEPLRASLRDATGAAVDLASAPVEGDTVRYAWPDAARRDGTYLFSYRVASADAHPVSGTIILSIGTAGAMPTVTAEAAGDAAANQPALLLRIARNLVLLAVGGAALYRLSVGTFPAWRAVLGLGGVLSALLALARLGVHGATLIGPDDASGTAGLALLAAVVDPAAWSVALRTSFGVSALTTATGAALLALAGAMGRREPPPALIGVGALLAIGGLALTGHAASATPAWLAGAALVVHAGAAAWWFASLGILLQGLRAGVAPAPDLHRFSKLAMRIVPLLVIAALVLATRLLRTPDDLLRTDYGRWLLLKGALLLALLVLAALNRHRWLPHGRTAALRRSIAAEGVLIAAVLGVTAALSQTPPHTAATTRVRDAAGNTVELASGPQLLATLRDASGQPIEAVDVEIIYARESAGVEPMALALARVGPGRYARASAVPAFAGTWQVEVRARVGDFDRLAWRFEQVVRPEATRP